MWRKVAGECAITQVGTNVAPILHLVERFIELFTSKVSGSVLDAGGGTGLIATAPLEPIARIAVTLLALSWKACPPGAAPQ
jgi:hypothetical protein